LETPLSNILRLGTRGSLLARTQSELVAEQLRRLHPHLQVQLQIVKTTGDRIADRPLHELGGKGLFTKELELSLLNGEIDFAVHSYKDVPVTMPLVDGSGLVIAATPIREDARDVLVAGAGIRSMMDLPAGATVGTGSLRRRCQLLHHRPDLKIVPLRGNIDTRLGRQRDGSMDAVVLAAAGLRRAGLFDASTMIELPIEQMVPAAGQGALALQCRADDARTRELLRPLNDPATEHCVSVERGVIRLLNADCHSPIGVHATFFGSDQIQLLLANGSSATGRVEYSQIANSRDGINAQIERILQAGRKCTTD